MKTGSVDNTRGFYGNPTQAPIIVGAEHHMLEFQLDNAFNVVLLWFYVGPKR